MLVAGNGMEDIVDGVHHIERPDMSDEVEQIRRFNRTWTEVLGLLDQGLLDTAYSLPEARVIFELAQRSSWERLVLRERLAVDASYLTRILSRLEERGLVLSSPSRRDGRAIDITLTPLGRRAFEDLNQRSAQQISDLLSPLTPEQRATITEAMTVITNLVQTRLTDPLVTLRGIEAGDMGWVIQRHGAIYFDEFGWDSDFEALVASIVSNYHTARKPGLENTWIAEVDGARAGCVFCCQKDETTAQLRILLVERWARGLGLGARLVDECIRFARVAGYSTMMLWTNDVLVSARRIYEIAGFELTEQAPHHSFGHDLLGQNWELTL
jgi:DNA-binding MarR family transcriptional regulator/GNAT superfamily N-acetyltransferase